MLRSFDFQDKQYRFTSAKPSRTRQNIFTILVGKNGTGKSRLISGIISDLIFEKTVHKHFIHQDSYLYNYSYVGRRIEFNHLPQQIIAISTSPFDRFPLTRFKKEVSGYSYLGIRDLSSHNFGLAYMSKIIASLIEAIIAKPEQLRQIISVLRYLQYTGRMYIKFNSSKLRSQLVEDIINAADPAQFVEEYLLRKGGPFLNSSINRRFFENQDGSLSRKKVAKFLNTLSRIKANDLKYYFPILEIDEHGIKREFGFGERFEDLIFLLQSGIVRIQDVQLEKQGSHGSHSIVDASSGEQSVVITMLGIASKITDDTLICIDEPEICLHPEWQEKYMSILIPLFKRFRGCHFIIATHSPQIISNLSASNCYILSMETEELINAKYVINHSADFQLVNIFNAPGYGNEYLARIALNVFTKVSKRKEFDSDDIEAFNTISLQIPNLKKEDPVRLLFEAIKEMYTLYAGY